VSEQLGPTLHDVADRIDAFRTQLADRPVRAAAGIDELRAMVGGPLPEGAAEIEDVVDLLARAEAAGSIASAGPRYFGFVIGGSHPAALAADWLTSGVDNNGGLYACAPANSVIEETAARWVVDLLRLPPETTVGFVTGGQMANFSGLAAGRHRVLRVAGWDVEARGLRDAPRVRVLVGAERHATIDIALRYLGLGAENVEIVAVDGQGRMRADDLRNVLGDASTPVIVCAQAGNINTGACDPFAEICEIVHEQNGWVHVDGAFGLWAAATDDLHHVVRGVERADSWATDAHKWLNVPYDCGLALCRHRDDHLGALGAHASYLVQGGDASPYDAFEWTPEFSRRARGVSVYAVIRALGRTGIAARISAGCANARHFAARLTGYDGVEVLNDVVLNQVLVRFDDSDDVTRAVIESVQAEGTCWMSGSLWRDRSVMRISVSNWTTTDADVDASVEAITRVHRKVRDALGTAR
jgi:glutamate/tyrosine decarboxylase-like PLP-dependent enzyme